MSNEDKLINKVLELQELCSFMVFNERDDIDYFYSLMKQIINNLIMMNCDNQRVATFDEYLHKQYHSLIGIIDKTKPKGKDVWDKKGYMDDITLSYAYIFKNNCNRRLVDIIKKELIL